MTAEEARKTTELSIKRMMDEGVRDAVEKGKLGVVLTAYSNSEANTLAIEYLKGMGFEVNFFPEMRSIVISWE